MLILALLRIYDMSITNYFFQYLLLVTILIFIGCDQNSNDADSSSAKTSTKEVINTPQKHSSLILTIDEANRLAELPLNCIQTKLPYKAGHTVAVKEDLGFSYDHHPAFYGCFDWHSAVHGHWSLVYLLKTFPELEKKKEARIMLAQNLTKVNIEHEVAYFSMNKYTKSFERTYGWAWVLKLQEELITWEDDEAKQWANNLQPLVDYIVDAYGSYLPKLVYPIRVGEHSNTGFGLSFAYDYAIAAGDEPFMSLLKEHAIRFYKEDRGCPISWEPSGYDFLSPCLQEIDIMRKVLSNDEFESWLSNFLPDLVAGSLDLEVGKVLDRSDGKLVHLDGANFSRAWCLYPLKHLAQAQTLANSHMTYSLDKITDGDYAGEHWLGSFALYAFKTKSQQ